MTTPENTPAFTRPTSPHLQVYRWHINMTMSILHRAAGLALVAGSLLLVMWLCAAAYSPDCFAWFHEFFGGFIGKFLLFGWTVAFYYHLLNGIRHLIWDMGHGMEVQTVVRSGVITLVGVFFLTVVTWIMIFSMGAA